MSFQRPPPLGPGKDTGARDPPKNEQDFRSSAILHQQRRLKQATQFVHKDSADLLPLDQLRRLGTSKDLQPYTVIQRRLLGGSPVKETGGFLQDPFLCGQEAPNMETRPPNLDSEETSPDQLPTKQPEEEEEEEEEEDWRGHVLLVPCKVSTWDVYAKLSTERRENHISKSCLKRLGLQVTNGSEEKIAVEVKLGGATLTCKAAIVDDDAAEFCMGLETLIKLKTCIDLEHGVLKTSTQEIPFMNHSWAQTGKTEAVTDPIDQ
ncbi:nuclear receptor-interacting protein 2 [Hyla sarda]|uniref:nuclear receptor-interacting protein 2 n=1 Tax=Hyla sarda TaxID=327740 RepID=UPI0024C2F699|nr:nuclear receptor-interacting protein 2 [Hyla sarda]